MDAVFSFFKGIVDLGAAVMLPIVLIIIGLFFRMKLGQAIKSGLYGSLFKISGSFFNAPSSKITSSTTNWWSLPQLHFPVNSLILIFMSNTLSCLSFIKIHFHLKYQ